MVVVYVDGAALSGPVCTADQEDVIEFTDYYRFINLAMQECLGIINLGYAMNYIPRDKIGKIN